MGSEGTTRDFDDFSTTEHLIALGRAEASEVVRRYALGTIAYPAPPMPVPAVRLDADGPVEERRGGDRRAGERREPAPGKDNATDTGAQPSGPSPGRAGGADSTGGGEPVTQPDPGT